MAINKRARSVHLIYQGLHMAELTACGSCCARLGATALLLLLPLLRDWISSLEVKLDLRLWILCWICGKALELCAQQLRQVGVTLAADVDCWMNSFMRWHAS